MCNTYQVNPEVPIHPTLFPIAETPLIITVH